MSYSTLDYLRIVAPFVPPNLVAPACLDRISALAASLPPSSNFGFECRLGVHEAEADFLVAVIPSDGSRGAWTGANRLTQVVDGVGLPPSWLTVQSFLGDWEGGARGFDVIYDTSLEFDVAAHCGPGLPEPSIFFGYDHNNEENHPAVTELMVEQIFGRAEPLVVQSLRRCYAALPTGAQIFQVGAMLARPTDAVRICIKRLAPAQIPQYLACIGWLDAGERLVSLLSTLEPLVDGLGLDLDVSDAVRPKIGLECRIDDGMHAREKLRSLLTYLQGAHLCLPDKASAISAWLGYCTERSDPGRWPQHLLKASGMLGPDVLSSFARTLNHIKIDLDPRGVIAAKAYLGVRHFWIRVRSGVTQ